MGVTSIKTILNRTQYPMEFRKRENVSDTISLDPGEAQATEIWVPWCDNQSDFDQKAIEVKFINYDGALYIWQSKGKIRYSFDGWNDNGSAVFGTAHEDGDRAITIREDFRPEFALRTD